MKLYIPSKENKILEIQWILGESIETVKDGVFTILLVYYGSFFDINKTAEDLQKVGIILNDSFKSSEFQ